MHYLDTLLPTRLLTATKRSQEILILRTDNFDKYRLELSREAADYVTHGFLQALLFRGHGLLLCLPG